MDGHLVIRRARELGWTPRERNKTARKHFYFDGPVPFYAWREKTGWRFFTVGNQTTSYPEAAIGWLEYEYYKAKESGGKENV